MVFNGLTDLDSNTFYTYYCYVYYPWEKFTTYLYCPSNFFLCFCLKFYVICDIFAIPSTFTYYIDFYCLLYSYYTTISIAYAALYFYNVYQYTRIHKFCCTSLISITNCILRLMLQETKQTHISATVNITRKWQMFVV